ncbi:MAG: HEAT repeat domain-containing protein [FCB group bacterium]|nr:HEAT repeat domain-containing protein [FCB group bacterium]
MKRNINLSEKNLKTDLKRLTGEIIHEFFILCRKAGIYSIDHPMVKDAVGRPFLCFQKLFGFKKYFSLVLTEGKLYANNIYQSDSNFIDNLKDYMQTLEIHSLLFDETILPDDLLLFVGRLVKRLPVSDPDFHMHKYLEKHNLHSIRVNDPLAIKLFETGLRYRDDVVEDFSIRRVVANHFSGEIDPAMNFLSGGYDDAERQSREIGIDFHPEIVNFILPEKFAQLRPSELLQLADKFLDAAGEEGSAVADKLALLVRSFDFHPKRDILLDQLREKFESRGIDLGDKPKTKSPGSASSLEASHQIDQVRNRIFSDDFDSDLYSTFNDVLMRLLRTRRMGKAAAVTENLVEYLASDKAQFRQHAINLLNETVKAVISVGEYEFLDVTLRHLQSLFTRGKETFEYSEVVTHLLSAMLNLRRYEPIAAFLKVLKSGRRIKDGVMIYDSVTVKRIFDELDNRETISRLVRELQQRRSSRIKFVHEILTAIQTEEVALQLADIVVHPERTIRQRCLKVLAELGYPAVTIFSEILRDEINFSRPDGRHELPDKNWFLIRNSVFVLGNLRDIAACNALRLRLADPDVRLRHEIIKALEKIKGEEATDLLMILAEDMDASVREAAIITLGLFKRPELARFFIDLLDRRKGEVSRIMHALGMSGSEDARDFFAELLDDEKKPESIISGKASILDVRKMALKGLELIGDEISQQKMKEFFEKNKNKGLFSGEKGYGRSTKNLFSRINSKK